MSNTQKKELLEPTGIGPSSILNICNTSSNKITSSAKPDFSSIKTSETLSKVKNFLPQLKKADEVLKRKLEEGHDVNIENVDKESNYVEMNVGLFETKSEEWSEDSEPDSPGSPPERDNAFTSDSDSSSTG